MTDETQTDARPQGNSGFLEEMMRTIARVDLGQSGWPSYRCSRCDF